MREFAQTQVLFGVTPIDAGDNMEYIADLGRQQPEFSELEAIVGGGGYFENILLGIELTATGAQRDVPGAIPGSTYRDDTDPENPVTVNRTWAQWVRAQPGLRSIKKVDENLYLIKAIVNREMMNSTQLAAAHAQSGVNVIEWSVVKFRAASEEWEEFEL
jgi:hypothetical protein